jgi:hypothetical protein
MGVSGEDFEDFLDQHDLGLTLIRSAGDDANQPRYSRTGSASGSRRSSGR